MDIYEYAKEYNADYYDQHTGYIYHVQNYNNQIKMGLPTPGIEVFDTDGNFIGYARKKEN